MKLGSKTDLIYKMQYLIIFDRFFFYTKMNNFQLYHVENKLPFLEMMMFVLY